MSETVYITTEQNQNDASTLASQGGGLVLVVGQTSISNGSGVCKVWTVTPITWIQNNQSHFTSYCEVEHALVHTKIFYKISYIPQDSFVIDSPEMCQTQTSSVVVNFVAETLSENKDLNPVIY